MCTQLLYAYCASEQLYNIYIDIDDTQLSNIYTHVNLTALKRECEDLDKLLILSKDIEFKEVLGEGILIFMHIQCPRY